jgi:hypothetical protein
MRRRAFALVLLVTAVVVVALLAVVAVVGPAVATTETDSSAIASADGDAGQPIGVKQAETEPTEIDSCREISEPGRYVLTRDVEDAEAAQCLRIRASDVVLDGRGHAVNGTGAFATTGVTVGA